MGILQFMKRKPKGWSIEGLGTPWDEDRLSLYYVIIKTLQLREEDEFAEFPELPDQDRIETMGIDLAPGNIDALLASKMVEDEGLVEKIYEALVKVLETASEENARRLYDFISEDNTLSFIDELLIRLQQSEEIDPERLYQVAMWLTFEAPDRGAVKTGIALLGLFQGEASRNNLIILGSHDEFTYFALNALEMNSEDFEADCFALARQTDGWGRIHAVKRLASTQNPLIKDWLLREGYRNNVAYEATAYECAKVGDLLGALQKSSDPLLILAAGDLICALIQDPLSLEEYEEMDVVMDLYLDHLQAHPLDLKILTALNDIATYTKDKNNALHKKAKAILNQQDWTAEIEKAAGAGNPLDFIRACSIAKDQGIDTWPIVFKAQEKEDTPYWAFLIATEDPERARKVIQLAERRLPLEEIASGPEDALGLGAEYMHHRALEIVIQALSAFPGEGWLLLKAALKNPIIRLRRKAVYVLGEWGKDAWPSDVEATLKHALEIDPTPEVREDIRVLLDEAGAVGED